MNTSIHSSRSQAEANTDYTRVLRWQLLHTVLLVQRQRATLIQGLHPESAQLGELVGRVAGMSSALLGHVIRYL
jgi:hypothetical protein